LELNTYSFEKVEEISISEIKEIVTAVKEVGGVDFSDYATASLRRRIIRLSETQRIRSVKEMLTHIREGKNFITTFINEVTVNTTEMFRDPGFWQILRDTIIPDLAEKDNIRIWHAACSTGEEVYSMCILLLESGLLDRTRIIATDINNQALDAARAGIYPMRNQQLNQMNYENSGGSRQLKDYYTVQDNLVRYEKSLISRVKFSRHDLTCDGPFSKFDLILSRNVMIYFNNTLQEKVLRIFDESLFEGGFLGIGNKESLSPWSSSRNYAPVCIEEKIYKKTK